MTKAELVAEIATRSELAKADAEKALDALSETTVATLKSGGEVVLPGLGKLSVADRAARRGRNPSTGEEITIAASKAAKFTASSTLKRELNG